MNFGNLSGLDIVKGKQAGEYLACCPFCVSIGKSPDVHYHLSFNVFKRVYRCYRCDAKGRLSDISELNILAEQPTETGFEKFKERLSKLFNLKQEFASLDLESLSWPISKTETPLAYNYLASRGFSDEEMLNYNIRVGRPVKLANGRELKKWSGRIIFPVMEDGCCKYITGRTINGGDPKYINSCGSKSLIVFNLDSVTDEKCIICEGIVSSIAAQRTTGVPAVAILGKTPTGYQLSKIRAKCSEVYLSLDGDVKLTERVAFGKMLYRMGFKVWVIDLPDKRDPDDLGPQYSDYFKTAKPLEMFL